MDKPRRYFYKGTEVPQFQAQRLWESSKTYHLAAYKAQIWPNAHNDESPYHRVAKIHLEEAGITITENSNG